MLNAGDIAIIGIKTELGDDFAFVALTDIAAGETIRFTDNGVGADGAFHDVEGIVEWTAPEGGVAAGTVVSYDGNEDFAPVSGFFALSTSGDQLIAFQGDVATPAFLFAVQTNSTLFQAGATNAATSALPTGLVLGETAVAVGAGSGAGDEWDSAFYAGPATPGTKAELLARIADPANWEGTDDAAAAEAYALPDAFTIFADDAYDLQITEIWMGNDVGANLTADWFELTNRGDVAWTASAHGDLFFDDESADAGDAARLNGIVTIAPGESVIFIDDDSTAEIEAILAERFDISTLQIGTYAGSGLGGGGDAVTVFVERGAQGDEILDDGEILDHEAYPDAGGSNGGSWDVQAQAFSEDGVNGALASSTVNDAGEGVIASPGVATTPGTNWTLELLHFTDQEAAGGAIVDAPNLSGVLNALRAQDLGNDGVEDNTLTLSSGDAFIPGVFFDASSSVFGSGGVADILLQNLLGVQAVALGNHEFDMGSDVLAGLISGEAEASVLGNDFTGAAFPYLSSNLDFSTSEFLAPLEVDGGAAPQANTVTSSVVIDVNGEAVGVVGATTPTLDVISSPGSLGIWPADFDATPTEAQLDALAAVIQAEVEALLSANPDLNKVILLAHMQRIDIELALAERLSDVDIIVAGGSNTRLFDDNDAPRAGDSDQGQYPQFVEDADGNTTAVVNTDGSYKYVGRLVIEFDEDGHIVADSYDDEVSGAYATDEAGLAAVGGEDMIDAGVQAVADLIGDQIAATEGNVFGASDVFLNGNRSGVYADPTDPDGVRTQETNLGNLTADANLAAAKAQDAEVLVSIKNGGGIRASIGDTVVPAGGTEFVRLPNGELLNAEGEVIKPEGGISQNDIQTALAFNNGLTLLSMTTEELVAVLEHGVSALPGVAGAFPQISGVRFSYDESLPEGSRLVNAGIFAEDGTEIARLVEDGEIVDNGATTFRVVTLSFLADGGDGYPFPTGPAANRVDLFDLDADGQDDDAFTGDAVFAADGTEQDALAEYLDDEYSEVAYDQADTGRDQDDRIQNLAFRSDAIFAGDEVEAAFTLELLHFTDQEAAGDAIVDAPNLSGVLNALRAQDLGDDGIADNTLTLSSGDAIIPGVFFSASEAVYGAAGIADILIQNALGVQAMALGNHEFDTGTEALAKLISGAAAEGFDGTAFPYLSANLDFATDPNLAPLEVAGGQAPMGGTVTSSTVLESGGELIGVVGATTPTLGEISSPGALGILPGDFDATPTEAQLDALAAIIQSEVDALLAANPGMNKVILLAHMQRIDIELALAERLSGVDIIVAGGSNTRLFDDDDVARPGDSDQGRYPLFVNDLDGNATAVVNTDGSYKYVGRLVIDFDEDGHIIADSYDDEVSGAYATDAAGLAAVGGEEMIDETVQAVADAIEAQIVATESNVFGASDVFLNGNRSGVYEDPTDPDGVRTQETNLGNLTADANLAAARDSDAEVVVSIKNGGGIRASIGETVVPAGGTEFVRLPNGALVDGDGNVVKPEGGISQNDIQSALAFNNGLTLLSLTTEELVAVLEHGISALPGVAGAFPQIAGIRFSYDETQPEGSRLVNAGVFSDEGDLIARLVEDGEIVDNGATTFRVVTLSFMADGGDGYPFPTGEAVNRVDLFDLDGDGVDDGTVSGLATFAEDGTEQDALAEYLAEEFSVDPYAQADTGRDQDERIQNLGFRADTVFAGVETELPQLWINEVDADNPSTDTLEFIELWDGGLGGTALDGFSLVLINGNGESIYNAIDLDGQVTDENGFFVIGSELVENVDLVAWVSNGVQNGADGIALVAGDAADYSGDALSLVDGDGVLTGLVDALVYDTNDGDDADLLALLGQTEQFNEDAGGDKDNESLSRSPDGGDWITQAPTPGTSNADVDDRRPADPAPGGAEALSATVLSTIALPFGAEIVDYDPASGLAFVTSGDGLQVVDYADPANPALVTTLVPTADGLLSDAITSVSVKNGIVAAAVPSGVAGVNGHVAFYSTGGDFLGAVEVGDLPDMLTFNADGTYLLTANEGQSAGADNEPDVLPNPVGSVSIIEIDAMDLSASTVTTHALSSLDGDAAALEAKGVRINPNAPSVGADIEPEYISIIGDKAYVALQENNAYAIIEDITAFTGFTEADVVTAGTVDHSIFGNGIDSSDRDGGIEILTRAVQGLRMPDGISAFEVDGVTYFASANEGDDREVDASRGADLVTDGLIDPDATDLIDALSDEAELGRLNISTIDGDADGDGDIDELYSFGTRSFTIYDEDGNVVFDSGDLIERVVAAELPDLFNGEGDDPAEFDRRSDNKGPEPESVVFGEVDGTPYLFVGLERVGGVMVFDVSDPTAPVYDQWLRVEGDLAPEGLKFIAAGDSPTGEALLAVANEDSNTVSLIQLTEPEPDLTLISQIQGSTDFSGAIGTVGVDDVSPFAGQTVTIRAVVTADFQDGAAGVSGDLNGYFVQEEDADADGDASTSEGLFIYDPSTMVDVAVGDLVTITGTVSEFNGMTQLTVDNVRVEDRGVALPSATVVEFPTVGVMDDGDGGYVADLEAYEGMLVTVPTEMTVSELFNLDRFGEYVVSEGERIEQFTQSNAPDQAGYEAHLRDVASRSVTLDDGLTVQNPNAITVIDGNDGVLSNTDTFSMGDTLTNVTGVVNYAFDRFRIQNPTGEHEDTQVLPETVGAGDGFKVASLNVLNYFTTIDEGADNAGPNDAQEPRGADSDAEFARQQQKLVQAIVEMDADVLGLMEIENDDDVAVADLVAAVNAALGEEVYGFIATGDLGGDAIAQALIYKLETAAPVGDFAALTELDGQSFLDPLNAGRDLNRPALAQTFEDLASGETLTVVVNHLKSKGSLSGLAADEDQLDGQGNNNATRAEAARMLAEWLAADPTGQGAENQLIIGDLNSYAQEDPIRILAEAGYTDLAEAFLEDAYSYVFDGMVGTLDYALASESLLDDVVSVIEWHINSNEADAFDYNLDFGRDPSLFDEGSPARNSDHDPVIVTFDFGTGFEFTAGDDIAEAALGAEVFDLSLGGNDVVTGTAAELDGDRIDGADEGDAVVFEGLFLSASDFSFDGRFLAAGGASVDFGEDLGAGRFVIEQTAEGTMATWDAYEAIGEVRTATLGGSPVTIDLDGEFENAVVFAMAKNAAGGELTAVRVLENDGGQITLMLREPKLSGDGVIEEQEFTLLVVEQGVHTLADGTLIEAGSFDTNQVAQYAAQFTAQSFSADFAQTPSVFTQVQSFNGADYVATRQMGADADGFFGALTKEEGITAHRSETVGWLAIEQGSGDWSGIGYETDTIEFAVNGNRGGASFSSAFDGAPNVIANVSSFIGDDHVQARLGATDALGFQVRAQEDVSFDAETNHGRESVDWIAFGGEGLLFEEDLQFNLADQLVA